MKVESGGRITLSGPLSRNDQLKSLAIGDVIEVRVLERISRDSAIIDLKGNRVSTRFSSPLPKSDNFALTLTKVTSESLQFSLKTVQKDFILKSILPEGIISLDNLKILIAALHTGSVGLFDFSLIISGAKNDPHALAVGRFLRYLLQKGFDPSGILVASALLRGMDEKDIVAVYNLLNNAGLLEKRENDEKGYVFRCFSGDMLEPDHDDLRLILEGASRRSDNTELFFVRDGALCSMNFLTFGESFAGRIETPHLGIVEFLVRLYQGCTCILSCRDSQARDSLAERISDMRDTLVRHYGKGSVQLFTAAEIKEKLIALTGEMGNHTFNVTA
jgi:hypothetical protein